MSLSGIDQQYSKIDYYKKIKVFVDKIRRVTLLTYCHNGCQ